MYRYVLLIFVLISVDASSQKVFNVLDWKPEYTLNTFLLQKMHGQYAERKERFAKAVSSRQQTLQYIASVQQRFRKIMGSFPAKTVLNPTITGTIHADGYRIEKIVYESFPGHHVTANLYIPSGKGSFPATLLFCGHEDIAKATPSYQQTALLFVKNGFVVLVVDPVSQSERYQLTDTKGKPLTRGGTTEHTLLNATANLFGTSLPAYELWDNERALDYLVTRNEVDTSRIGCIGNSGGGIQTIYFAAFDKRIKVIAPCSYLATRERTLELSGPADGCAQVPDEGKAGLEMVDMLIAAAPRPVLVLAGRYDFIDYTGTEDAYKELQQVYGMLGQRARLNMVTIDDGHGISKPKREAAVSFFRKWLCNDPRAVTETDMTVATPQELMSSSTGQVNTAFPGEISILLQLKSKYDSLSVTRETFMRSSKEEILQKITELLNIEHTDAVITAEMTGKIIKGVSFNKYIVGKRGQPPVPLLLLYPDGVAEKCILWLPGNGKAKIADSLALMNEYLKKKCAVIIADLRGMGETEDKPEFNDPKYYNKEYRNAMTALHAGSPLVGQRTTDILTVMQFIQTQTSISKLRVEVHASGIATLPAIHAALFDDHIGQLFLYNGIHSFSAMLDDPLQKDMYSYVIPGVLSWYDIPDLLRQLGSKVHELSY